MKTHFFTIVAICVCLATLSSFPIASTLSEQAQNDAEANDKPVVTDEFWGVELQFDGYHPWVDHPLYGQPNLVIAGYSDSEPCYLNLSMFAEVVPLGTTADECRKSYAGNPAALKERSDVTLIDHQVSPITYTLFDQHIEDIMQNQLYGYWTRSDICFELHISSMKCDKFKDRAMPILQSVRLSEDKGATHETVALARETGRDPGDWRLHILVANAYLHNVDPPEPSRARSFYMNTLELAGSELDPMNHCVIEEGMGLAWLMEDNGKKAIPHLIRALEIARKSPNIKKMLLSTLYNIACAYSITGDPEKACSYLAERLSLQDAKERKETLKQVQEDKQLVDVRSSECYSSLMAQLEQK